MEARRSPVENVSVFWARFEGLLSQIDSGSLLSPDLLFLRAFKALNLSHLQKTSLLTFLECRGLDHSISNLKACSIRLFAQYQDINTSGKEESLSFMAQNSDGFSSQPDEEAEQVFVLRRKGKGTSRNRPGNEVSAMRKATNESNIPNDSLFQAKGLICFRCGKTDHILRDCPLPYTEVLAYAPHKGGKNWYVHA